MFRCVRVRVRDQPRCFLEKKPEQAADRSLTGLISAPAAKLKPVQSVRVDPDAELRPGRDRSDKSAIIDFCETPAADLGCSPVRI